MVETSFAELIVKICQFFERKPPAPDTLRLWFGEVAFIPEESLEWIQARVCWNENFPRNLPNAMKSLFRDWLSEHPEKRLNGPEPGCENCEGGYLTVWYHDDQLGRLYSHTFRCAHCNSDGYPRAMPAVTAQKLAASGKYFVHPRQVKFAYHDFFSVLEVP